MTSESAKSPAVSKQIVEQKQAGQQADVLRSLGEQVNLFKYLSAMEREMIFSFSKVQTFEEGDWLLQEGDPGIGLFVIDKGSVRVTRRSEDSDEAVELATIHEGGHFGEMSLLNQQPLSASVQAKGNVSVHVMPTEQFSSLLTLHKSLSNKILRAMCEELSNRLRKANLYIS